MKNKLLNSIPKYIKVEQFFSIRQITDFSISPDSKTVAYITNTNGLPNIWTISIDGGWTSQISLESNAVRGLKYSPVKRKILFQSDENGDENQQIFMINDFGGVVKSITETHKGSQVFFIKWNKKGNSILYASNKRDKKFFDTYIYDFENHTEQCIFKSESLQTEFPVDLTNDERFLLINRFCDNSNQDLILYELKTKTSINITQHSGPMKNFAGTFDIKNRIVYFLSDYEREFLGLAYYDIKKKKIGWYKLEKWDISGFIFSSKGKYLLYQVNEDGRTRLKLKNLKSGKSVALKLPKGKCLSFDFSPDEKNIVVIFETSENPGDIYVYRIKSKKYKQITFSMIGGITKNELTAPHPIKYKSFDGLEIAAHLFIPKWLKKDGTNPAIVWAHGGPEAQVEYTFNKYLQIFSNRGYVVIAPNFRGSTGYGKKFQRKIYGDWGGNEFKDVLGSYNYLLDSGYADKNNIAVVGGSFGGFMTLTCVTKAPDLWKCAVDIFGPTNLFTFLNSIPEYWKPMTFELVGNPENQKELLQERSPIFHVDNIKCPLFIIQGENDPRVVKAESDQIVGKLKSMDKEVEYFVLPDEGHGFTKVSNQILAWNKICSFIDKHLKGENGRK
jgi:dipeptidyl aminopeptidase/acylaminoacyl peptidase